MLPPPLITLVPDNAGLNFPQVINIDDMSTLAGVRTIFVNKGSKSSVICQPPPVAGVPDLVSTVSMRTGVPDLVSSDGGKVAIPRLRPHKRVKKVTPAP